MSHRSRRHLLTALGLAAGLSAAAAAQAQDIGFARAEQIALNQVKGRVEQIERKTKRGQALFEVEVRTAEGRKYEVRMAAEDGRVLEVKQDD